MDRSNPTTIYLIDDDASVRKAMKRLLRVAGYETETFASCYAFLESPFRQKNTVLVVDIHIPGLNGLDLKENLLRSGIRIPVIFITAYDNAEKREKANKMGAAAYFRKPVDAQALLDAIEWVLGTRAANHSKEEKR